MSWTREQIQSQMRSRSSGRRSRFVKLGGSENTLRFLPGDPMFVYLEQHTMRPKGQFTYALNYDYLLYPHPDHEAVLNRAQSSGRVTKEDLERAEKFGDPFGALRDACQQAGVDTEKDKLWPNKGYLWAVVDRSNDGTVGVLQLASGKHDAIIALLNGKYPELVHPETGFDVDITGNGQEGRNRRYTDPVPNPGQTPVGFDWEQQLPDLYDVASRNVQPWVAKANYVLDQYPHLTQQVGIDGDTWEL